MRGTAGARIILPRFRQLRLSLVFILLLLLSICSATDCFQQLDFSRKKDQRRLVPSLQTASATTSIALAPAIGVYGGGVTTTATEPNQKGRRWVFGPERRRPAVQQQRRLRRRRRESRAVLDDEEYQRRKQKWAATYCTLDGLRQTFGCNKNKLYGDLDAATTRKLYKSLLPTAVCELVLDVKVRPEEMAQLAFEARKAAKLYARERCHVPARWLAIWYDGFRALKRYGRFQIEGMSYDQVFDKYYQRSAQERLSASSQKKSNTNESSRMRRETKGDNDEDSREWTEEDIVTQTCMKILESACRTNPLIDRMTLLDTRDENRRASKNKNNGVKREDLEKIVQTLEDDVRKLLDPYNK